MQEVIIDSPLGRLKLNGNGEALLKVSFTDNPVTDVSRVKEHKVLEQAIKQLDEYFAGERTTFELPLSPEGTHFQKEVWQAVLEIPYGRILTYGELSEQLGNPKAIRAVGTANGSNPIPIIISCHRVVGAGQKLTGYSGGIDKKRWLLKHEGVLLL